MYIVAARSSADPLNTDVLGSGIPAVLVCASVYVCDCVRVRVYAAHAMCYTFL